MNVIEAMLTGELEVQHFKQMFLTDEQLRLQVDKLIPDDAINNRDHPFWEHVAYVAMEPYNFKLSRYIFRLLNAGRPMIGENLNIWGSLKRAYTYYKPDLKYTDIYLATHDLYLNTAASCFDGPEVQYVTEQIILDALTEKTKSRQKQRAKQAFCTHFHIEDKIKPRWIQGAEWPMGINSPMKFIAQKRKGEIVCYTFADVDTGEARIIEQYY